MPKPTKGARLGGSAAHEKLLLANLAKSLFEHGRITTTEAKARRLRPYAERLVTKAKKGDLHNRRQVLQVITDKSIVHTLFTEIGPRYENRPGGYTRITKIGNRRGDNAPMAVIELVEALTVAQQATGEAEAATKRAAKDAEPPRPRPTRPRPRTPRSRTPPRLRGRGVEGRLRHSPARVSGSVPFGGGPAFALRGRGCRVRGQVSDEARARVRPGAAGPVVRRDRVLRVGQAGRGRRTVQGEIEDALRTVTRSRDTTYELTVAGRTDAGVHARGQVAHVDLPEELWAEHREKLLKRLAGRLPKDVRVWSLTEAPGGFNARFSAIWRRYAYRVTDNPGGVDPLLRGHVLWHDWPLDVDAMNEAAGRLLGEHDFAAYCKKREGATTIRTLQRAEPGSGATTGSSPPPCGPTPSATTWCAR